MNPESISFWKKEGWKNGFLKMVIVLILFFLMLTIYRAISKHTTIYFRFLGLDVINILTFIIPIVVIFYSFTYKKFMIRRYFQEMGLNFTKWKGIIVGLAITLLGLFALVTAFHLRNAHLASLFNLQVDLSKSLIQTYSFLFWQIISVALWEEIIFRGYLQNLFEAYFSEKTNKVGFAAFLSIISASVIFTTFHFLSFNELTLSLRLVNIFCGSMVIGYAYYKSRLLWVSVFVHGAYNVLQSIVELFITDRTNFVSGVCNQEFIKRYNITEDLSKNLTKTVSEVMGW